ncbi:LAMI_0F09824g1_1 [Lachancea mirantina]|uniref:LAMI_0F09824g1_1 n=1 Tax=Lachancea mirantina TaxID=1230905 RepID=A0A1G4K1M3_9SACH|nr:LAMI_0F09824g1_1 [Lachancea mirantina]
MRASKFLWTLVSMLTFGFRLSAALSNEKLAAEMVKHKGVIKLNNANFEKIIGGKRDAYMVVLLTASSPQIGCSLCVELEPEFKLIADSWIKDHPDGLSKDGENALFFAKADFEPKRNNEVFMHFNVNNVPRLLFLTPGEGSESYNQINLPGESGSARVLAIVQSLSQVIGINDFRIHEPISWGSVLISAVATMVVTLAAKKYRSEALRLVKTNALWAVGVVFIIILWNAGYMFNTIRGSQFVGMAQDGSMVHYFLEGQQQNQYGVETQIITVIYAILAINMLCLIKFVPYAKKYYQNEDNKKSSSKASMIELVLALTFSASIYLVYSALMGVFRLKSTGYPFKLFKLPSLV